MAQCINNCLFWSVLTVYIVGSIKCNHLLQSPYKRLHRHGRQESLSFLSGWPFSARKVFLRKKQNIEQVPIAIIDQGILSLSKSTWSCSGQPGITLSTFWDQWSISQVWVGIVELGCCLDTEITVSEGNQKNVKDSGSSDNVRESGMVWMGKPLNLHLNSILTCSKIAHVRRISDVSKSKETNHGTCY